MNITRVTFILALLLVTAACSTDEPPAPDDRPLGVSAKSFLSEEQYTSLTVELVYVTGFEPSENTVGAIENFLRTYLNKPEGITIKTRAVPRPGVGTYSLDEIRRIEDRHRTEFTAGSELTAFIFIADNISVSSTTVEKILGKAYGNTSMVIFGKEIYDLTAATAGMVSAASIEQLTIKHEFGHLFGLVDNGTPAQSDHVYKDPKDSGEKGHCDVEDCLMAMQLDYQNPENIVLGELCHIDLVANGGK